MLRCTVVLLFQQSCSVVLSVLLFQQNCSVDVDITKGVSYTVYEFDCIVYNNITEESSHHILKQGMGGLREIRAAGPRRRPEVPGSTFVVPRASLWVLFAHLTTFTTTHTHTHTHTYTQMVGCSITAGWPEGLKAQV